MDLKTTTRPNRHADQFRAIKSLLPSVAGRPVEVANIGSGLAVKYLGRLAEETVPGWDLVKRFESGVRRIPMPDACFENYEARELARALDGVDFNFTVIDINPKVVRVVAASMPERKVRTAVADLAVPSPPSLAPLAGAFDLIVTFAMMVRVPKAGQANAANTIRGLLRPGGILLTDWDFTSADCRPVPGRPGFFVHA